MSIDDEELHEREAALVRAEAPKSVPHPCSLGALPSPLPGER